MKILVVAAEESASLHAEGLVRELSLILPEAEFFGAGSEFLAGLIKIRIPARKLSFVGLEEPSKIPGIFRAFFELKRMVDEADAVLLIDYPGLNLRLARHAKSKGKKVLYYVAPQVWAWGSGRVKILREAVDALVCLFPFEEPLLRTHGVNARFFGHPLAERLKPAAAIRDYICFLPGSRVSEVKRHLGVMMSLAERAKRAFPEKKIAFIRAPGVPAELFSLLAADAEVVEPERRYETMSRALAAVCASGTATLELALLEVPTIVLYRINPLTFFLGKRLAKVSFLCIVNILAGRQVFPEFLQDEANDKRIWPVFEKICVDHRLRNNILASVKAVTESLKGEKAYKKAAEFFGEVLLQAV